jgi:hypothetical protein
MRRGAFRTRCECSLMLVCMRRDAEGRSVLPLERASCASFVHMPCDDRLRQSELAKSSTRNTPWQFMFHITWFLMLVARVRIRKIINPPNPRVITVSRSVFSLANVCLPIVYTHGLVLAFTVFAAFASVMGGVSVCHLSL